MNQSDDRLPAVIEMGRYPATYPPAYSLADDDPDEARIPLSQYLWILKRHRWRICGFVFAAVMATLILSFRLTPIYESTVTVDIDRQTPPGVVGQEATRSALNDADQFLATQIKLVESDSVLRPVDRRFHLRKEEKQASSLSGRGEEAPVTLSRLKVTRPPNTYLLLISYRSPDPTLAADTANAIAQSYLEHTYNIRIRSSASLATFMEKQLEELKAKMERSSQALAGFEKDLNVINPEEKTNILASRLLQLNTERTVAQADRLRQEAAFESVEGGSMAAALATGQGDALRKLAEHLHDARERFVEVQSHYGSNHPEYRKSLAALTEVQESVETTRQEIAERVEIAYRESERREAMVEKAVQEAKAEFDQVNARSFEYQDLKREAEADKNLYEELVRKIKEASINAGFQNSSIRIADPARPALDPVFPDKTLNILLAFLFSSLVAMGAAVVSDVLDKTIRDPDQAARTLRTEVIGSLPLMKNRRAAGLGSPIFKNGAAVEDQYDLSGFNESVRTLRNSILLASFDRRYRSLLITSATPGEGKTTTAVNLAAAHAEQGKRTLLLDGDLRRPSVHRHFNLPSVVGLSNVLLGEIPWRQALIEMDGLPALHILPAGPPSRRASDLVGRGLVELLEDAASEYDLVVLDAPPFLGFAEPLQMATAVDGVIVVARAGQTTRKAVATVLATLNRLRAKVVGVVLNEVHKELSDSYRYYGYVAAPAAKGKTPDRYFHFDSWRANIAPGEWIPSLIYVEEEGMSGKDGSEMPRFKGQTRIWDYAAAPTRNLEELTSVLIDSRSPVNDPASSADVSPLESQRSWEQQAEANVVARLERGGLLAPPGPVDEVLNTVVNNLIVSAHLNVEAHCRVLLTTPLETFTFGRTIVISRGLIDVLPDEASLALVLAAELAHVALGHRTQTQFAFNNQTMLSDVELLQRFRFQRAPEEMRAAGKKTIEIMRASPYQKTGNAGLFLKALAMHGPSLPGLVKSDLGNQVANADALARLAEFATAAPALDEEKLEQIAALPLGSRVRLSPWDNQLVLVKTRPIALLSSREKMPFEVTPFVPHLIRVDAVSAARAQ